MVRLHEERLVLTSLKLQLADISVEVKLRKLLRALKANFNPAQPRDEIGRWSGGHTQGHVESARITDTRVISDETPDGWIPGAEYAAAKGHHFVSRGVFTKEKYNFSSDTIKALEAETTGRLQDPSSNFFDKMHREYNEAIEEALDRFIEKNNIRRGQMTAEEARAFASEVRKSDEPRIRQFNKRVYMREIMRSLRYFRGRE